MNSPITGGAERHTFSLSDRLTENGIEAAIFAIKPGPAQPPGSVMMLKPATPRRLPARIGDLASVIRDLRPDALITVNERPLLVAFAARALARAAMPIVAVYHSTILRNRWQETMQLAYTPLFNRAESVVFISENQRRYWSKRGFKPRRSTVILNGVDTVRYSPAVRVLQRTSARTRLGFDAGDLVVGLCALIRPEKNHLQLLRAVARLRQAGVPAKALLVGDGPLRGAIEDETRTLGIESHVVFAGMHDDVRPLLAAIDVGALCSTSVETLSLAALEIMALGIPMVMSRIGGASEIIDGDNGRLFAAGDDAGLVEALASLADAGTRAAAGSAARLSVERFFDQTSMIQSYVKHLGDVVAGDGAGDEQLSSYRGR